MTTPIPLDRIILQQQTVSRFAGGQRRVQSAAVSAWDVELIHRLLKHMRIDVAAKTLKRSIVGGYAFWNIGGAVKRHMLKKVRKSALIITLILRARPSIRKRKGFFSGQLMVMARACHWATRHRQHPY